MALGSESLENLRGRSWRRHQWLNLYCPIRSRVTWNSLKSTCVEAQHLRPKEFINAIPCSYRVIICSVGNAVGADQLEAYRHLFYDELSSPLESEGSARDTLLPSLVVMSPKVKPLFKKSRLQAGRSAMIVLG